jgi:predicted phosphodiesterase
MLLVISDLHLTDGTTGRTIGESAFEELRQRVRETAFDASWQRDAVSGEVVYRPIPSCDIVLLGDILDIIRSTHWTDHDCPIRPWPTDTGPDYDDRLARKVIAITDRILEYNCHALTLLRQLGHPQPLLNAAPRRFELDGQKVRINHARRNPVCIPAATTDGKPDYHAPHVPVPARIFYVAGNHDWFFVRRGVLWDSLRARVIEALGLAWQPEQPFPWDLTLEPRSNPLVQSCLEHRVFVRHGEIHDPFNYNASRGRDWATMGDALVIEVVNRFPVEVERVLGKNGLNAELANGLREIANVRPIYALPAWLNSLMERIEAQGVRPHRRRQIQHTWNNLVDNFLASAFIRSHDSRLNPFEPVDQLQIILNLSKAVSPGKVNFLLKAGQLAMQAVRNQVERYARAAASESWLLDGRANFVVYGHTHHQQLVPLDRRLRRGEGERVIYFNAGTWKPLHEMARFNHEGPRFVDYTVMSYTIFFRNGERKGRSFETWSGSLANGCC